jgi:hypothetical protein
MTCVISFRWHKIVLFVANILVNVYCAEETAGSDHINHVDIMMMKTVMLTVTLKIRNTVDNMNHVLQLDYVFIA